MNIIIVLCAILDQFVNGHGMPCHHVSSSDVATISISDVSANVLSFGSWALSVQCFAIKSAVHKIFCPDFVFCMRASFFKAAPKSCRCKLYSCTLGVYALRFPLFVSSSALSHVLGSDLEAKIFVHFSLNWQRAKVSKYRQTCEHYPNSESTTLLDCGWKHRDAGVIRAIFCASK
jgi:hypothetical protein